MVSSSLASGVRLPVNETNSEEERTEKEVGVERKKEGGELTILLEPLKVAILAAKFSLPLVCGSQWITVLS